MTSPISSDAPAGTSGSSGGRTSRRSCWGPVLALGVLVFAASMLTCLVTIGIWPGEAKLTAPLFCPDDKTDAYVVVDSYSVRPGETSYNFSLYCMGPRGEVDEIGFLWPCVVLTLAHGVLIVVLVGLGIARHRWKRRRRADEVPGVIS